MKKMLCLLLAVLLLASVGAPVLAEGNRPGGKRHPRHTHRPERQLCALGQQGQDPQYGIPGGIYRGRKHF